MKRNFSLKMAWRNIQSNRQLYIPYLLSSIVTVAMFHMMASLMTNDYVQERSSTLPTLFAMGTFVVAIFSIVFIFYANSFLVKRRKKEWGLYSILGLEKKHIARILITETLIVGGINILVGLLVGILFGQLSFMFLNYLLQLPFSMTYAISWEMTLLTIGLFIGIFFLTLLYNIAQVTFSNPIHLLKGSDQGEKEPKSSPFLFLIGLVTLGAGYYISVTIEDPLSAISEFFTAVLLVIVGTYLLFNAGSIIVLKWMKRSERIYYQPGPFISISGMLYRMKQHATGLANISILAVMVIVAVSTTVTIFVGTEETLQNRFPEENNVSFVTDLETTSETLAVSAQSVISEVTERTEESGLEVVDGTSYRYASLMGEIDGNR
ncbi:MAG TPA: ABC transporter permease, partial [Atopostipes sp.]|nr:ABC transporter permease [Atopostipes sp.]